MDIHRLNGSKIGHLTWSLNKLKQIYQETNERDKQLVANTSEQTLENERDDNDLLEFRYYGAKHLKDSSEPSILAKSISLKIYLNNSNNNNKNLTPGPSSASYHLTTNSINNNLNITNNNNKISSFEFVTFRINEIKATQLRKGMFFNPDPYVKITIVPNSFGFGTSDVSSSMTTTRSAQFFNGSPSQVLCQSRSSIPFGYVRDYKTKIVANTCFPNWKNEVILFLIYLYFH